ncbi:MAG: Type III restriction-modification system methylation subunit [Candidatus Carbobacillus altaicus]|uniref:Type III restriction-modification system methylation subunit n=1 Tax=Candidatus Carbonibacillus altaicus TaxID=2163959 RepID=A0A2R6XZK8_9BACL|nr:MAG: Type III restriction-modification system methylation subunit [Candidatus Carbobacillus altaicus]
MKKLTMKSVDLTQANIDKIAELFPNVITEARDEQGKIRRAVDFDLLEQELSDVLVEGEKERYQLTWPGKKQAILNANTPIDKTLRPVKEDSVDWDNTQNLYIEGDNLEVLKLFQESYLNKVKCIYIDPPYNTGKDFVYKDDFREPSDEYMEESGQVDEEGNRLFQNTESNGRFHSDWLTMMYSRLKIARNLLRDDGVIFISIDDNEVDNLSKICDEIFGAQNCLGRIIWKKKINGNNMGFIPPVHDYIIVYAKNINSIIEFGLPVDLEKIKKDYSNPDNDPRGPWTTMDLSANHKGPYFKIVNPLNGDEFWPPEGRYWVFNEEETLKRISDGRIIFGKSGNARPVQKVFLKEKKFKRIAADSLWDNHGMNEDATLELRELFGESKLFTHPKPSKLLYNLIRLITTSENNDIVLDFFSGSATTAHAVMQLNAEDGGNRRYIMVQLSEQTVETSEAYKAGFKNICEIGKERIRRAAKKIKKETGADIDYGFRVFRVDSSNMKDVYYAADKLDQGDLFALTSNIKEDRTSEDLLIQVMLELGLELSLPMETKQIERKTVHYVGGNSLIACFDEDVPESVIKKIADEKPLRVVFRDSSFKDDSARINVEERFKTLSPGTEIQVL